MRRCPAHERRPTTSAGFTLVEIAVVIVVLALLLAMIAGIVNAIIGTQRRESTRQRLAGIETALALFVSQNARLPCPADGRLASTDINAGSENPNPPTGTCAGNQAHGVVPWRALGLAEQDVTDGWGNRFTYRVAPEFVKPLSMNMTFCDPGGSKTVAEALAAPAGYCDPLCASATFTTNCTQPSAVTAGRGLAVKNLAGAFTMNPTPTPPELPTPGAAYVVISHGENSEGAYNSQGFLMGALGPSSSAEERMNAANRDLTTTPYFVDDYPNFAADPPPAPPHFDDILLRPAILAGATKAQMGPRAH